MVDLLEYVSRGSKRSRLWLVKVLGQVTADKAVADAVADRQGVGRSSWKDFVPTWGLTRQAQSHAGWCERNADLRNMLPVTIRPGAPTRTPGWARVGF